ncbi:MAG: helix-turn-helix transcriptional regulator [Cytophagales bacterium]
MVTIGNKIKKMREDRGLSQKEVASVADIDRGQYSRIETNKVEPSLSTLEKIALAFKVDVEEFFKKEAPVNVDSFDKTLVEKVKIIEELEAEQKSHIYAIIDMAVSNNRLKNTLTNALQVNF